CGLDARRGHYLQSRARYGYPPRHRPRRPEVDGLLLPPYRHGFPFIDPRPEGRPYPLGSGRVPVRGTYLRSEAPEVHGARLLRGGPPHQHGRTRPFISTPNAEGPAIVRRRTPV